MSHDITQISSKMVSGLIMYEKLWYNEQNGLCLKRAERQRVENKCKFSNKMKDRPVPNLVMKKEKSLVICKKNS